jgi:hypothetical protein
LTQAEIANFRKREVRRIVYCVSVGQRAYVSAGELTLRRVISVTFDGRKIQLNIPTLLLTDWVDA